MLARERLNGQMDPLVPFQIVITIEALWTLIAFKRTIVCWRLLMMRCSHEMRHCRCGSTVNRHHPRVHAAY
jgi:hypothetical protein